jgi:tRNA 2-selenouridine synthase
MRSAGVAWLLDLYGFKVYTLTRGYKSFRNWVLQQFDKPYPFSILGGYTGSGKTGVLKELAYAGHPVIDLEGIARHKGSSFGALGEATQPTQEMFENMLGLELYSTANNLPPGEAIWLEDESRRIGLINIPGAVWERMQRAPLCFLDVPMEQRLNYITEEYGKFKKEELVNAIMRIQKRLGGLNTKNAINCLLENNYKESFRILLNYYDKYYERGLQQRKKENNTFVAFQCSEVDAKINSIKLRDKKQLPNGITHTGI